LFFIFIFVQFILLWYVTLKTDIMHCYQLQQILLVPSTHATCCNHTDHLQALNT